MKLLKKLLLMTLALSSAAVTGALYFLSAGRWDLPLGWAVVAVIGAMSVAGVALADPGLLRERTRPGPGAQDRALLLWSRLLGLAAVVVAGLDVGRFHWSDGVPLWLQVAGVAALGLGFALSLWAMTVNRFFSSVIRLQDDRDHQVITGGPYRWVRHPGYAGVFFAMPGLALALSSWLCLVPMLVFVALVLRRLVREDRFLHAKLEGYADYARDVRFKLIPGIW